MARTPRSVDIEAEMVANVMTVYVGPGDAVAVGDTVVLLESMKMEIPVLSESAGTVSSVNVAAGDVVQAVSGFCGDAPVDWAAAAFTLRSAATKAAATRVIMVSHP
jgi:pyruvate/2-oxoglutarate dehydrogenase complex dihydrolipoamide acyltransferase (E2) component